jgi:hypothetical protein
MAEGELEDLFGPIPKENWEPRTCAVCGEAVVRPSPAHDTHHCSRCAQRYPPSLIKACQDQPWDYMLRLRTGEVLRFEGAAIHGDYATITLRTDAFYGDPDGLARERKSTPLPAWMMRGLDVRVADIVWCADAPNGS